MAVSDVLAQNTAVDSGKKAKSEAFKAKGRAIRSTYSEDQKQAEGAKSDKIAFICALGDPAHKQNRVESGSQVPSYTVVGFKFKALEAVSVPNAPIKPDFKTPLDVENPTEKKVKAGEIFTLNLVETAMLISKIEYAGTFTGEGTTVSLSAAHSATREEPTPNLKTPTGSVKSNMELIADMADGKATVKDEFAEKFAVLFARKKASRAAGATAKTQGEAAKDVSAAFRALYEKKFQ